MLDRKTLWFMLLLAAVTMVIVMAGCSDDDEDDLVATGQQTAFLSGAQVDPGSNSLATGTATITYANLNDNVAQNRQVRARLVTTGLINVTTVQMRLGLPDETGPVLFTLFNRANANTQFPNDFTRVIRASDWVPAGGINTFDEFVSALRAGRVYIIANTVANPAGEIRGQIGATRFVLQLTGQSTSTLTPTAVVTIDQLRQRIRLQMPNVGIPNATAVRFVYGGLGGPRLMTFREQGAGPLGPVDTTLGAGSVIEQPSLGINNFPDLLNALYAGQVYLVVFTSTFPGGEYIARVAPNGQVLPQIFTVAMSDTAFTPALVEVPAGSIIRFRNDSTVPLRVVADSTNQVAAGPNSNLDFPGGIAAGQTYEYQVPLGTAVNTNFFYHEATRGAAGNGVIVGTGMAGDIRII
ncbi:MAG: CHRD domain-containing protein [Armatimonadota bacterium]